MTAQERILLADDEQRFTRTTAALLRDEGYECDCAADGPSALKMLGENVYDLLISDIKMPGNANLELVRAVSQCDDGLPIILVTAYPEVETAIESVELAVVSYLRKPVEFIELLHHVQAALANSFLLRRMRHSRNRVRELDAELTGLLNAVIRPSRHRSSVLREYLECTAASLVHALSDVMEISEVLEAEQPEHAATVVESRSSVQRLTAALTEAVQVLKETRGAFKSKQLGELRKRLEQVIDSV